MTQRPSPCSCDLVTKIGRIARERDALATRVQILEAALKAIDREAEHALSQPGVAFLATRRIASVARQAR